VNLQPSRLEKAKGHSMPLIEDTIPARAPLPHGESRRIPPLLFQTFKTPDLPELMYQAAQSWITHNPGFEYRFFDDDAQAAFIRDNFDPDVFTAYQKIEAGAFRADLWRYCVLWVHGGVYADIDTICRSDLTLSLRPEDEFVVSDTGGNVPSAVFNAFIAARPQHPFLKRAIARATNQVLSGKRFVGYEMVGPANLGAAMNLTTGCPERTPMRAGTYDHAGSPWRIIEKRRAGNGEQRRVVDGNVTLFNTEYDEYRDELASVGVRHWHLDEPRIGPLRKLVRRLKRLSMQRNA